MPTTQIQNDGTILITLSDQEKGMAQMILADKGASAFDSVFSLQFTLAMSDVMNKRFAQLSPADQTTVLTKLASV